MINTSRSRIVVIVTVLLALVAAIIAIGLGSVFIPVSDILSTIFGSSSKAVNATICHHHMGYSIATCFTGDDHRSEYSDLGRTAASCDG